MDFPIKKWWFSIAMLVHQRVTQIFSVLSHHHWELPVMVPLFWGDAPRRIFPVEQTAKICMQCIYIYNYIYIYNMSLICLKICVNNISHWSILILPHVFFYYFFWLWECCEYSTQRFASQFSRYLDESRHDSAGWIVRSKRLSRTPLPSVTE